MNEARIPQRQALRLPRISIEHIWCLTVLVGIFVFVNTHPIRPHDFWWHMAVGRQIVTDGQIPTVDTFSYTAAGQPYPSYKMFWLMEVAFYLTYSLGGAALVVFVHGLGITAAYGLLMLLGWRVTGNWRAAALGTLFAAALGINDWNVRPQAVTFLLGALFLWAIDAYRRSPRWGWLLVFPLGMVVWANSHGTFPLGLLLIGLWLLDEAWTAWRSQKTWTEVNRLFLMALLPSALACLLNPRGLGILDYLLTMSGSPIIQSLVPEWAPPSLSALDGKLFYAGLLFCTALLLLAPRRPMPVQALTFLGFAALALRTSRGILWFGLVMAPVVAENLAQWSGKVTLSKAGELKQATAYRLNLILAGALVLVGLLTLPWFKSVLPLPAAKAGLISAETPVQATRFLIETGLPGPLFHAMPYGSYLIWAAQPEYKVFVDSRLELYSFAIWQDYLAISSAQPGWGDVLAKYNVRTLMLSRSEQPTLVAALLQSASWAQVYEDPETVIFVRVSGIQAARLAGR